MPTTDLAELDYAQLGTPVDDLHDVDEVANTPELRQFAAELTQHFRFQARLVESLRTGG